MIDLEKVYLSVGQTKERPFNFSIAVSATSFGDALNSFILAERIAANFKHSVATFLISEDRPYKMNFINLYRRPHRVVPVKPNHRFPMDLFVPQLAGRKYPVDSVHWQDLIVPPQMGTGIYWWALPYGRLGFHPKNQALADELLRTKHGLRSDNWFVALHYREPNYKWKKDSNVRDVDPNLYNKVIDWVIDEYGGQVVRLGHPEMQAVKARPGLVDLSRIPNSELLQAYAVSRSAFLFCSPSGAVGFADAFRVPNMVVDSSDFWAGNDSQVVLTHTVIDSGGVRLRNAELMRSPYNTTLRCMQGLSEGCRVEKSTEEELRAALAFMIEETKPQNQWRLLTHDDPEPSGYLQWPLRPRIMPRFFDPKTFKAPRTELFELSNK